MCEAFDKIRVHGSRWRHRIEVHNNFLKSNVPAPPVTRLCFVHAKRVSYRLQSVYSLIHNHKWRVNVNAGIINQHCIPRICLTTNNCAPNEQINFAEATSVTCARMNHLWACKQISNSCVYSNSTVQHPLFYIGFGQL